MPNVRPAIPAILTALLLALPLGAAGLASAPEEAAPLLADQLAAARDVVAFANGFPAGAGLSVQLARMASLDGAGVAAQGPAPSFDEALAALYAQAGLAAGDGWVAPEPALAAALAPVLVAVADSARLTDEAFAALSSEERAFLLSHLDALFAPSRNGELDAVAERVHLLSARVDMPTLVLGATSLALALDEFTLPPMTATWLDPLGLVEVGSTGNDVYSTPRVLIVDLGGNDVYQNRPATYHPNLGLALPVSVILDLGGNDVYTMTDLDPSSKTSAWGEAVGIGGVGIIVDRWGDDQYVATLDDANGACDANWYEGNAQVLYAQAVGALGVGAILDLSGNDFYWAHNANALQSYCHFGWAYTFAQGVGMQRGIGLLVDDTGDEVYHAHSYSVGKADNTAATYAQAVGVGGLGALLDKEGSDLYEADAVGFLTYNYVKGAFAYVFSQASVATTRRQPASAAPATMPYIPSTASGLPLCGGDPRTEGGTRCEDPGIAILLDVLGDDRFVADAHADDLGYGCGWAAIAVTSAQGSAAWTGLAALLNLDAEGSDEFVLSPYASATNCSVLGVRALAYGQGYGGPIYWNYWESPPTSAQHVAVGILASVGILDPCRAPVTVGTPGKPDPSSGPLPGAVGDAGGLDAVDPNVPGTEVCGLVGKAGVLVPHLTLSPDSYLSSAFAAQGPTSCPTMCVANAESWAQGASNTFTPPVLGREYRAFGVGILIDTGGDDAHRALADSSGPTAESLVVGQGGTRGSVALLANVGGDDAYDAFATENRKLDLAASRVQGWAEGGAPVNLGGQCLVLIVGTFCLNPVGVTVGTSLGVFVEVFGWDRYSEASERSGCQQNGTVYGTWPVGTPLGPSWWGTVVGHPCATPTPDVGTGNVIAVDWLSDVGL